VVARKWVDHTLVERRVQADPKRRELVVAERRSAATERGGRDAEEAADRGAVERGLSAVRLQIVRVPNGMPEVPR